MIDGGGNVDAEQPQIPQPDSPQKQFTKQFGTSAGSPVSPAIGQEAEVQGMINNLAGEAGKTPTVEDTPVSSSIEVPPAASQSKEKTLAEIAMEEYIKFLKDDRAYRNADSFFSNGIRIQGEKQKKSGLSEKDFNASAMGKTIQQTLDRYRAELEAAEKKFRETPQGQELLRKIAEIQQAGGPTAQAGPDEEKTESAPQPDSKEEPIGSQRDVADREIAVMYYFNNNPEMIRKYDEIKNKIRSEINNAIKKAKGLNAGISYEDTVFIANNVYKTYLKRDFGYTDQQIDQLCDIGSLTSASGNLHTELNSKIVNNITGQKTSGSYFERLNRRSFFRR